MYGMFEQRALHTCKWRLGPHLGPFLFSSRFVHCRKCWSLGGGSALLNKTEIVPKYGLTLIRIQVLTIYWQTVLDRMDTSFWWNGEFMGYFFLSHNSRWPMIWIADYELLLQVITYLVIAVERRRPFSLWW